MKKVIIENYIVCVGEGAGGIVISDYEAEMLVNIFARKPSAPSGYDYRLRADTLEWVLVELPPIPEDDEISAEEALEIIRGGAV